MKMLKNFPVNSVQSGALVAIALAAVTVCAQDQALLRTKPERDSYAVGVDLGRSLKRRAAHLEAEALVRGLRDALSGQKLLMTEEELRDTIRTIQIEERQRQAAFRGGLPVAEDNAAKGAAFLAQNKAKPGVVVLPSGLQYQVLKAGTGRKPVETDTVECQYRASHIDGREFNSSDRAGQPAAWAIKDGVPAGIKEALLLMPVGSKWQVFIPPQLAYGEKGAGASRLKGPPIGPNETLIYEIELLAIK